MTTHAHWWNCAGTRGGLYADVLRFRQVRAVLEPRRFDHPFFWNLCAILSSSSHDAAHCKGSRPRQTNPREYGSEREAARDWLSPPGCAWNDSPRRIKGSTSAPG